MRTSRIPPAFVLLAALSLLLLATACNSATKPPPEPKPAPGSSAALWAQIQAEVGDAACDGPQQCRSIAVGNKPCGGPEAYLAWSTKRSDETKLNALVAAHAAARLEENRRGGMMSDCAMVSNPGASCQAGQCKLQPPGFGKQPGSAI
jgi:hypothetical protein